MDGDSVEQQVRDMLGAGFMTAFGDEAPPNEPIVPEPMKVALMKERLFGEMQNCLVLLAREIDELKRG